MTGLSAHFNISLNPKISLHLSHLSFLSHLSMIVILLVGLAVGPTIAYGTNESSYQYGYQHGSLKSPQFAPGANWNPYSELNNNTCALGGSYILTYPKEVYGTVIPAKTNTTACINGWFSGWKNWCSNHAVDCVQNITLGDFPDMIVSTHQEYLRL